MRYWFYSNGNINGPLEAQELMVHPSFAADSLVCEYSLDGTSPSDWKRADSVDELSFFSVATENPDADIENAVSLETEKDLYHANILDTIDEIIHESKYKIEESSLPEAIENIDLKISHVEEQLETAVWEKNLLLEKLKIKEKKEEDYKDKIRDLEERVNQLLSSSSTAALKPVVKPEERKKPQEQQKKNFAQLAPETESLSVEKNETLKNFKPEFEPLEKPRSFKKLSSTLNTEEMGKERLIDMDSAAEKDVFDLKSFGKTKIEANPLKPEERESFLKEEESPVFEVKVNPVKSEPASIKEDFNFEVQKRPEPIAADFTQIKKETPAEIKEEKKPEEAKAQVLKEDVKPQPEPVLPQLPEFKMEEQVKVESKPQVPAAPQEKKPDIVVGKDSFSNMSEIKIELPAASKSQVIDVPSLTQRKRQAELEAAATVRISKPEENDKKTAPPQAAEATTRLEVKDFKKAEDAKTIVQQQGSYKKNKVKLYASLAVLVMIVVGGFIFLMDFKKDAKQANLLAQSSQQAAQAQVQQTPDEKPQQQDSQDQTASSAPIAAAEGAIDEQKQQESVSYSAQNTKLAIEAVKKFNLSDGRGSIENWFMNSFSSTRQSREEWTATLLQGKIFVVQYRLIRQKQEPLVYQFEVNCETGQILRGINNNAIDLLESSEKKKTDMAKKEDSIKAAKPVIKKKPVKKDDILPLPEREESEYAEPTGFENSQTVSRATVKITAPESDEELF